MSNFNPRPISAFAIALLFGCQPENSNVKPEPDRFEMNLVTISKHESIDDPEITERKTYAFSTLAEVQDHLRLLDWLHPSTRYQIEITRRGTPKQRSMA